MNNSRFSTQFVARFAMASLLMAAALLAKNGGRKGVPEVDVCFHFFELRSPPPDGDTRR